MMRSRLLLSAFFGVSIGFGSGCAQAPTGTASGPTLAEQLSARNYALADSVERIPDYRVDGWYYLDREHIILKDGVSRRYLVTLMTPCSDLSSQEDIGFTTTTSTLTRLDKLVVNTEIGPRDCPIKEIHALEALSD